MCEVRILVANLAEQAVKLVVSEEIVNASLERHFGSRLRRGRNRGLEQKFRFSLENIFDVVASIAFKSLFKLKFKRFRRIVGSLQSHLCFLELLDEVMEVLSRVLLLTGLEFLVTLTEE